MLLEGAMKWKATLSWPWIITVSAHDQTQKSNALAKAARLEMNFGNRDAAESLLKNALRLMPGAPADHGA